ncbi:MAG: hypothetical protein RIC55_32255 [Pirellulaceae bacterium]
MSEQEYSLHERDDLDRVLAAWAARNAADGEQLLRLENRIHAALDAEQSPELEEAAIQRRQAARWRRIAIVSLSSAAVLLVALLASWLTRSTPAPGARPNEFARISNDDVARKRVLLAEMEHLFDGRVEWIAESADNRRGADNDIRVGLVEGSSRDTRAARPLVVRLVVIRRTSEERQWRPVRVTDVVLRDEQYVQLPPQADDPAQLSLWSYVLPDGMVALDTDLDLPGDVSLEADSSNLQEAGVPLKVFSTHDGDAEYEVYQTVRLLDDQVG